MSEQTASGSAAWVDFDWSRERYEDLVRRVIPDYERQDAMIARAVSAAAPASGAATGRDACAFRILELGAGTGSLSHFLLDAYPRAMVTAVDVSSTMLAECRRALAGFGERARVVEADLATVDLLRLGSAEARGAGAGAAAQRARRAPLYHAVVSRLAIHHLDDAGQEALMGRVFAALEPGGIFVNSDMIAGEDQAEASAMMEEWRGYMRGRGDDPTEWEKWLVGDDDHPATESAQLAWLRAAGFAEVQVVWRVAGFALLRAVKAART